jgi:hypothetical protein
MTRASERGVAQRDGRRASAEWHSATAGKRERGVAQRERRASTSTSTAIFNFFPPDEPAFDYSHTKVQHPLVTPLKEIFAILTTKAAGFSKMTTTHWASLK